MKIHQQKGDLVFFMKNEVGCEARFSSSFNCELILIEEKGSLNTCPWRDDRSGDGSGHRSAGHGRHINDWAVGRGG